MVIGFRHPIHHLVAASAVARIRERIAILASKNRVTWLVFFTMKRTRHRADMNSILPIKSLGKRLEVQNEAEGRDDSHG